MKPGLGRKPYTGLTRSLVLALDIGTTFSGVSYAILEPGDVPKIHGVTRFPGQEHVAGNSKIPSIMYYDIHGNMKAAGAEADGAAVLAQAEDEGWIKTELFKLRLRPKSMQLKMNGMRLSTLPRNKTAVDVFGDFLSYLFRCTHSFIVDTHANGHAMWRAVEHDIQFVLSHPNGWEGAQQTKMRRAAVIGGLIQDTDEGKARIRFVTEGEASLHACVLNGLAADVLSNPSGHGFLVADAGGGTLDISSYAIRATAPLVIEEIAPPDCVFAGSVFVSRRARAFFEEKLRSSKYGTPDSLDHIAKRFDETTKRLFRDDKELQFVPFGSPLDRDMNVGIRGGQLKLTGAEVAALFEPSIMAAISSIKSQIHASAGQVKSVWLVGGFAASPWLFSQLQERLAPLGVTVSRPDSQTSKAVADGAIGFYCDHHVSARVSKFMYGVEYLRNFDPNDEDHIARKHRLFELPSGPKLLPDAFDCILARGVKVKESTVFSRKYCTEVTNLSTLSVFEVEIWCFRGGDVIPKWIIRNADNFSTLCYVRADLSPLAGSAQPKEGKGGKMYWTIVFSIEIHFGLTEFRARIKWTDNNKIRYGPASIVYNESGHRADEDDFDSPDDDSMSLSHSRVSTHHGHRSSASSKAPSRRDSVTPSMSVSRSASVAHSSHSSHKAPVEPLLSSHAPSEPRTRSTSQSSHSSRPAYDRRASGTSSRAPEPERLVDSRRTSVASSADRGKHRDRSIPLENPPAPPIAPKDRSANISAESRMSLRTNATAKLGEALTSVWGTPSANVSVAASKIATPLDSPRGAAASYFEAAPSQPVAQDLDYVTPPSAPPPELPSVAASKPPSPPASKTRTPMPASGMATPRAIPPEAISPPPQEIVSAVEAVSKPSTPPAASKVQTPAPSSRVHTPAATPKVSTPGATTPRAPAWGASKAATPAATPKPAASVAASHAPTPKLGTPVGPSKAPSKAPTPKSATPRAVSRVPSPKPEPELQPTEQPPAPAPQDPDDDAVIPPRPEAPLEQSHATPHDLPPLTDTLGTNSHHTTAPSSAIPRGLGELWASEAKPESAGFGDFLTSDPSWEQTKTPVSGPGSNRESGIAQEGADSKFSLSKFASWSNTAAKTATNWGGGGLGTLTSAFGLGGSQELLQPPTSGGGVPGGFDFGSSNAPSVVADPDGPVIPEKPPTPGHEEQDAWELDNTAPAQTEAHPDATEAPPHGDDVVHSAEAETHAPPAEAVAENAEEAAEPAHAAHEENSSAPEANSEPAPAADTAEHATDEAPPHDATNAEELQKKLEEHGENVEGEGEQQEDDEFDWANTKKKGKKGKNTPGPEEMSRTPSTTTAGGGGNKKGGKKKKGK